MTDHAAPTDDIVAEHDPVVHMDSHTTLSDDDHGHAEMALGPIDWRTWALALLGTAAGALVLACFWVALS